MSKGKPVCLFCKSEVDVLNDPHYLIKGPDGNEIEVHDHVGVKEHGGVKMFHGEVVKDEEG